MSFSKMINSEFIPIEFILGNEQIRLSESNNYLDIVVGYLN